MAKLTIIYGVIFIVMGLYGYFGISNESITALIPTFFGIPMLVLGWLGLNENEKQTFEDVSKLIHIRKEHSALRYGDFLTLQADENVYAYLRSDMNERILTVINKNPNQQKLEFNLPAIYNVSKSKDLVSGKEFDIKNNKLLISVDGTKYLIMSIK